ncbi:MAG: T9SS type A sorting domain-containing protein [Flavobacteriales bacterium]|nr:T9SS type A sorting domain-containing protein [Flavobacteriales bacterium]
MNRFNTIRRAFGLLLTTALFATAGNGQYCIPSSSCTFPDIISNVTFAGINNTTACDAPTGGFTFFSALTASVTQSSTYSLSITTSGDTEGAAAWIDYNQNNTFEASELVISGYLGTVPAVYTTNVTIPITALPGTTRMRVRCVYAQNPTALANPPCDNVTWGETEDYVVSIAAASGCTGTPVAGTVNPPSGACPGAGFTLTVSGGTLASGTTFQWESSTDNIIYTPISGATGASYASPAVVVTTWFRRVITCTASGQSATTPGLSVAPGTLSVACYCTSNATSTADTEILGFSFASLANNPASPCTDIAGPGSLLNRYANYTTLPAPVVFQGVSYPFSVIAGSCSAFNYGKAFKIFIDWNRNGVLSDPGEEAYVSPAIGSVQETVNGNILIPVSALTGNTLMRVVLMETTVPSSILPCGTYTWGETEDYFVNVAAPAPCVAPPSAGTVSATGSAICSGSTVTFSTTGYTFGTGQTYQWEYSSDNILFNPISGATNLFYTAAITTAGWYRLSTTCSAQTATSNAVQITLNPFFQCYCTHIPTYDYYADVFNVTLGTLNNSSNCGTTGGFGSVLNRYSNFTNLPPPTLPQGVAQTIDVTLSDCIFDFSSSAVRVFIDFNQNGSYADPGEAVYTSSQVGLGALGTLTLFSGSFTVPIGIPQGNTGMRVIGSSYTTPSAIGPCSSFYGEVEDYVVNIGPAPTCLPPTAVSASSTSTTGGTVAITCSACTGNFYVEYGAPGFTPGTNAVAGSGTVLGPFLSTDFPISISGLVSNTTYGVRVRRDCGAGDWSPNTAQITFTTAITCGDTYTDQGGPFGDYPNFASQLTTICPITPGNVVLVTFSSFQTEASFDPMYVFNGPTTASPMIASSNGLPLDIPNLPVNYGTGGWWGNVAPNNYGPNQVIATNPSGCLTFHFVSDDVVQNPGWVASIACLNPACLPPIAAPVPSGPNSINVNWSCIGGPCTGDFYVEYGLPGFVPGTNASLGGGIAVLGPFTAGPVAISGLTSNTLYAVRVRKDCGGGVFSANSSEATVRTALTCGDTYTDTGGPFGQYGNSENTVTTICPNAPDQLVLVTFTSYQTESGWDPLYAFNGPSTASPMIASTNGIPSGNNIYGPGGWWGATAPNNIGPNQVLALNPSGCLTFAFTSDPSVTQAGWIANITCISLNSTCATAQTVSCNSSNFGFNGVGTPNLPGDACPFNGPASTGGTNWFRYIAANTGEVTASVCGTAAWDTRISVFRAIPDCSNLQCWALNDNTPGCSNGTSEVNFPTTAGETYYIVVHGAGAASGTYSLVVLCNASCGTPVPNETCAGAVALSPVLQGSGGLTTYDNTCAYSDGSPSCAGAQPTQGMWYTFNTGTKTELELTLHTNYENSSFSATSIAYAVYSGTCTSASATGETACNTGGAGTSTLSGLTPFSTYRLLIYNTGGIGVQGTFGLNLEYRPDYDASVISVDSPIGLTCGTSIVPLVTIRNNGLVPLTSVRIYYNVDAGPDQNTQWNGFLAPGATTQVQLPVINVVAGTHILNARTEQPNNQTDEIPSNDAAASNFNNNGQPVRVVIRTDNFGGQIGWDIIDGFGFPVASGGLSTFPTVPYGNNTTYIENFCLSTTFGNCYSMFLYDINGDGMCCANGSGSWELRDWNNNLILRDLFASTPDGSASPTWAPSSPGYVNGHEFCLPKGPADIEPARCNIFTYTMLSKVFSVPVAGATNYQFEFTDPDAGFRRRIAVPRNWVQFSELAATNPLIPGVVYFARVRVDQGSPGFNDDNFGAGCDMGITGAPNCTSLINQLTLPTHSCNVVKSFGFSDKIWTYPVVGATNYRFRFTNAGEGYQRVVGRTNYVCPLNWLNQPLVNGSTYQVDVEVRVSGVWSGYCGGVCTVTIANPTAQGGRVADGLSTDQVELWPNPVSDGQVNLRILGLTDREQQINVDVFDLYGKRVLAKHFENSGELFNTVLDLGRDIAAGMYQVNITVNDHTYTERLSVQ